MRGEADGGSTRSIRSAAFRPALDYALVASATLLFLWPIITKPTGVIFPPRSEFTDLLITHLPNATLLRRSVWEHHEWPLWNPLILGGQPFAADPLAGVWYPPNWFLLLPVPLTALFNLLFGAHMAWGGIGMYRFLALTPLPGLTATPPLSPAKRKRGEGKGWKVRVFGALTFMGMPKLLAHLGAGHVSLFFAVAWTPWLMIAVRRAAREGGWQNGAIAGACLAILFLADVRWAFYAAALASAYFLFLATNRANYAKAIAGFVALFLMLTAVLSLPLYEFLRHSARASLTAEEAAEYSLPPNYLLGLLIPDLGGFHEWMTYLGFLPLALAGYEGVSIAGASSVNEAGAEACGGRKRVPNRESRFWLAIALAAAVFSLGSYTPLFDLAVRVLPGVAWLRVPARAWFLVGFAVCILAARGAGRLADEATSPRRAKALTLLAVAVGALAWGLALGGSAIAGRLLPGLFAFAAAATIGLTLVALRAKDKLNPPTFLLLACLASVGDLLFVDSTLLRIQDEAEAFAPARALADYLAAQPGGFRVYSPSYSLPQHVAAKYNLEIADGINPLQLASTVAFMEAAGGVPRPEYSVTLPPFANGDPATANAEAIPDAKLLGLLNVRYVAAEYDLDAEGLNPLRRFGRTRLYENSLARSRAWVEFRPAAADGQSPVAAKIVQRGMNFLTVEAVIDRPGLLVLAEAYYPGWRAAVDGQEAKIARVDGLLRGVNLDAGAHRIEFRFAPRTVIGGGAISLVGLLLFIAAVATPRKSEG